MQLVTKTSNVLYTRRGVSDVVRYTPEKVLEDFGVTPAQIPDLKGLMGDASDNIPGIPGIGERQRSSCFPLTARWKTRWITRRPT